MTPNRWSSGILAVGLFVSSSGLAMAQAGRTLIEGIVTLEDGTAVAGAEVKSSTLVERGGEKIVTTKKDGRFKIPFAQPGPYKFTASNGDLVLLAAHVTIKDIQKQVETDTDLGIDGEHMTQEVPVQASRSVQLKLVLGKHGAAAVAGAGGGPDPLQEATRLMQEGDQAGAEAGLKKYLESEPDSAAALYLLGVSTAAQGRKDEALGLLARALELDPTLVGVRSQIATISYEKGDKEKAVTLLREEMDMAPTEVAPAINLGIILAEMGRREEAVKVFERAIEVAPTEPGAYMELATLYTDLGEEEKAAETLKRAEQVAKPDPRRWFNIGANFSNEGQEDKAEAAYRKAIEIDPSFPEATRELGFTLLRRGNFKDAIPYFEKYLQLRPNADDAADVKGALEVAKKNTK